MRQPNKNRSRNKNNRSKNNMGNVVNRVFDSAGPEGKVRGTPSQIIEKYQSLARDAQLSGDRVAAENFQQHSEHYTRMLAEAQRQQDAANAKREAEQAERNRQQQDQRETQGEQQRPNEDDADSTRQDGEAEINGAEAAAGDGTDLVDTPEDRAPKPRRSRRNSRKDTKTSGSDEASAPQADDAPVEQAAS